MAEPLTDRQRQVLDALTVYIGEHGYPPSMRDLAGKVGLSFNTVHYQLDQLVAKGWITRAPGIPRSIRVVHLQAVSTDG